MFTVGATAFDNVVKGRGVAPPVDVFRFSFAFTFNSGSSFRASSGRLRLAISAPAIGRSLPKSAPACPTLERAVEETIISKTKMGLSTVYVNSLRHYLLAFIVGRENLPVSAITSQDIEAWFTKRGEKPVSRAANLGRLSALFAYAERREWIVKNPCRRVEHVTVLRKTPVVLTTEQAKTALEWTAKEQPHYLAFLTLGLLCGLRPEEARQTRWESVQFSENRVVVEAQTSKMRRRRVVRLEPSAVLWLKRASEVKAALPIHRVSKRRFVKRLRDALGLADWAQDLLRHTAATMLLGRHQDAGKVATLLGNSAHILMTHYAALVSDAEVKRFWEIVPA